MNRQTRINTLSFLRNHKRILLFFALMFVGSTDSPCSVVPTVNMRLFPAPAAAAGSTAQYSNPAVVDYLVRDENGTMLSETELGPIGSPASHRFSLFSGRNFCAGPQQLVRKQGQGGSGGKMEEGRNEICRESRASLTAASKLIRPNFERILCRTKNSG